MIPHVLLPLFSTLIIVCNLCISPFQDAEVEIYKPDPAEVTALAQTLYGECRGCSELQQRAVCWTVFNRVDDPRFPDNILDVLSAPYQFMGYSTQNPVWDSLYDLAYQAITDWHHGENRVLEPGFCFFFGTGTKNVFSTEYGGKGDRWAEE